MSEGTDLKKFLKHTGATGININVKTQENILT